LNQAKGPGEHCKNPGGVWGGAQKKSILVNLALEYDIYSERNVPFS